VPHQDPGLLRREGAVEPGTIGAVLRHQGAATAQAQAAHASNVDRRRLPLPPWFSPRGLKRLAQGWPTSAAATAGVAAAQTPGRGVGGGAG
jgi:hypothetical protein